MRQLLLSLLLLPIVFGGCVETNTLQCGFGNTCGATNVCDEVHHLCIEQAQLDACAGAADRDACSTKEIPTGFCDVGVCLQPRCGDMVKYGEEQCDGTDFGGLTCANYGFYDPGTLGCNLDTCLVDTSMCTGFCGDGNVRFGSNEVCDGAPPATSCIDFGFGAGFLDCSDKCTEDFGQCQPFGWQRTAAPTLLADVHGTADDDIFAVGFTEPVVIHFDGNTWSNLDLTSCALTPDRGFLSVVAVAPNQAVALTRASEIAIVTPTSCTKVSPPAGVGFVDAWATSATNIYAVNDAKTSAGGTYHYNGATWTQVDTTPVSKIWGSSADDIWVGYQYVVYPDTSVLKHFTGGSWSTVPIADLISIDSIWGSGPNDVYFAGQTVFVGIGILYHYSNGTVEQVTPGPTSFWGGASAITEAYGNVVLGFSYFDNITVFTAATPTWKSMGNPGVNAEGTVTGLWTSPSGKLYATNRSPYVYTFGGTLRVTQTLNSSLMAVEVVDHNHAYAATSAGSASGNLYRWDGIQWSDATPTSCLVRDVWTTSTDVYALCASGGVRTRALTSAYNDPWSTVGSSPSGDRMWGTTGTNFWVLAQGTSGSTLTQYNSGATFSTSALIVDLYGVSASAIYGVGAGGYIAKFNGASWAPVTSGVTGTLFAVRPVGNEVYAVGQDGTILHEQGSTWTKMPFPLGIDLLSLWGSSSTDLFVGSLGGLVYHYDGAHWSPVDTGTSNQINAIAGGNGAVFFGVNGGDVVFLQRFTTW